MLDWFMVLAPIKCHWTSQGHWDSLWFTGTDWIHLGSPQGLWNQEHRWCWKKLHDVSVCGTGVREKQNCFFVFHAVRGNSKEIRVSDNDCADVTCCHSCLCMWSLANRGYWRETWYFCHKNVCDLLPFHFLPRPLRQPTQSSCVQNTEQRYRVSLLSFPRWLMQLCNASAWALWESHSIPER